MEDILKNLSHDTDGMATYEFIVNHHDQCDCLMGELIENLKRVDLTGQFLASSARFLSAVDAERYREWIAPLVEGAIEKDREHRYIGSLLEALWGPDYMQRVDELYKTDDNFRRIYKRIYEKNIQSHI